MRVIAGRAHGRRLDVPRGGRTRPTSGLVRGAVLNMLEQRGWLADAVVLDLFAGSGALGIEALSRGAREAVFVDHGRGAARTLRANLARSGFTARAEVLALPVPRALELLARRGVTVDGVIADPPYGAGWVGRTLAAVLDAGVLAPGAWIAVEHRADEQPEPTPALAMVQRRRYGETVVTLLARTEDAA